MSNKDHRHPQVVRARPKRASGYRTAFELKVSDEDAQRDILAKLRHDLRTPLNAIIGYSEMLLEDAEDMEHIDFISDLRNIHSAGNKSLELVNTILHPARIESGQTITGLESFGANLRHELSTPSNAIISFTERLLKIVENIPHENTFIEGSLRDIENIHSAAEEFLMLIRSTENFSELGADVIEQIPKISAIPSSMPRRTTPVPVTSDTTVVTADCGNLLVVDDNAMNRDLLSRHLERQGHEVMTAKNGRHALSMIRSHAFDLVLLDIMMPEMDGYQVLQRLKNSDVWRNIPVIMISALDEMRSVVRCIEMGAEDYLTKPFDPILLKARVSAVLEKKRLRDKEQLYLKSLELEMEIGRDIQASFLPDALPKLPGWEIATCFHPARQVSGDFYDAFLLSGGQGVGIVIADVCDKGVGAALFMGLFRSLIRAFADMHYSRSWMTLLEKKETDDSGLTDKTPLIDLSHANALKIIVSLTNDYIAKNHSKSNMFATLFLGVIEPETGILTYINGGHEPPVIVGSDGIKEHLESTGSAVGLFPVDMLPPDMNFETRKTRIEPGDILVSFTDGITEALGPDGDLFTKERLFTVLSDPAVSAQILLDRIEMNLSDHTAGADQSDDITLLAVQRMPVANPVC